MTCEQARLRGRYGIFRIMKCDGGGYRLEVRVQKPTLSAEPFWAFLELYDYLSNARGIARGLHKAMSPLTSPEWPLMPPRRVQLSRKKGWQKPANTVVVARPTQWGNPWKVGDFSSTLGRMMTREDTVQRFSDELKSACGGNFQRLRDLARTELRGRNLACWCPLGVPCHADVLLEIANR